jgi:hypothetical protein
MISTAVIAVEIGLRLLVGQKPFQPALFVLLLAPEFFQPLRQLGAKYHAGMDGSVALRRINFSHIHALTPRRRRDAHALLPHRFSRHCHALFARSVAHVPLIAKSFVVRAYALSTLLCEMVVMGWLFTPCLSAPSSFSSTLADLFWFLPLGSNCVAKS